MSVLKIEVLLFTLVCFVAFDAHSIGPQQSEGPKVRASNPNIQTRFRDAENLLSKQDLMELIRKGGISKKFSGLDRKMALTQSIQQGIAQELENIINQSMKQGASNSFKIRDIIADIKENHIRLDQYYKGLRVYGGDFVVHFNPDFEPLYTVGNVDPNISLFTATPGADRTMVEEAITTQLLQQGQKEIKLTLFNKEPLIIYGGRVAYQYDLSDATEPVRLIVDAESGEILLALPLLRRQIGTPPTPGAPAAQSGNRLTREDGAVVNFTGYRQNNADYYLYSFPNLWGIWDINNARWQRNTINNWGTGNRPWVSGGRNAELILSYVSNTLQRNGLDNLGQVGIYRYPLAAFDAYWDPNSEFISIGSGQAGQSNELAVLDVMAHEYCHGLQQHTSDLTYGGEPGALNEAYADIFACLVEFASQPDGRGVYFPGTVVGTNNVIPGFTPAASDWLMGEDCIINGGRNAPLRDFRNPHLSFIPVNIGTVRQPSRFGGTDWFPIIPPFTQNNDYGGVHYNGGVMAFAFYLLSEGGSGTNETITYGPITGIGWANAGRLAMDAVLNRHVSNDGFTQARQRWLESAAALSFDFATVARAWSAVGVGTFLEISNVTISNTQNYNNQFIQFGRSGTTTTFETTAIVTAHATEAIVIKPEFRAKQGSYFRAYIN